MQRPQAHRSKQALGPYIPFRSQTRHNFRGIHCLVLPSRTQVVDENFAFTVPVPSRSPPAQVQRRFPPGAQLELLRCVLILIRSSPSSHLRPKPLSVATIVAVTVASVGILTLLLFLVVHIYRRRARKAALMAISRFTLPALMPSANTASPAAAPTGNASRAGTRLKASEAEPLFPPSHSVTGAGSSEGDAELPALRGRGFELEIDATPGDRGAAESEAPPPSYCTTQRSN